MALYVFIKLGDLTCFFNGHLAIVSKQRDYFYGFGLTWMSRNPIKIVARYKLLPDVLRIWVLYYLGF